MNTVFHRAVLGLTLIAGAQAALAATVNLSSWTFGSGNNVSTTQPAYAGAAGGFSGTVDGAGVMTYCVELTQEFYWSTNYSNYTDETATVFFGAGSDKALKMAKLISYAFYDSVARVSNAAQSTSLQLAIWNIVYDNDYSLASGSFADTSAYASYANTLLTGSQGYANVANVWVLASPTQQDQLHWSKVSGGKLSNADSPVPEPGTVALVLLALGAAGVAGTVARRRG